MGRQSGLGRHSWQLLRSCSCAWWKLTWRSRTRQPSPRSMRPCPSCALGLSDLPPEQVCSPLVEMLSEPSKVRCRFAQTTLMEVIARVSLTRTADEPPSYMGCNCRLEPVRLGSLGIRGRAAAYYVACSRQQTSSVMHLLVVCACNFLQPIGHTKRSPFGQSHSVHGCRRSIYMLWRNHLDLECIVFLPP